MRRLVLTLLPEPLAVCRLPPDAALAAWAGTSEFVSITRTADELSVVCPQDAVPDCVSCERGWRCLKVAGPLQLSAVGVLAALAAPLAEAGVSVFAVSTFDTDYLLVKEENLATALEALRRAGQNVQ